MSNISKRTYDTIDNELDAQITNLKDYVDTEIAGISGAEVTKTYVDDKATETLNAAKQYAYGLFVGSGDTNPDNPDSGGSGGSDYPDDSGGSGSTSNVLANGSDSINEVLPASFMLKQNNNTVVQTSGFGILSQPVTITGVKGNHYYLMRVRVDNGGSYPNTNTFPIYVPGINDDSKGLRFVSNGDGTCYVSGIGSCTDKNVVIPSTSPEGDKVTSIGDYAFYNRSSLTSITIQGGIKSIGANAFYNCINLTDIYYTNSKSGWNNISIGEGNSDLADAAIHYSCDKFNTQFIINSIFYSDSLKSDYVSIFGSKNDSDSSINLNLNTYFNTTSNTDGTSVEYTLL